MLPTTSSNPSVQPVPHNIRSESRPFTELLNSAKDILRVVDSEQIGSNRSENKKKLNLARQFCSEAADSSPIIAPGLTKCIATTLLKFGLCLELSQRFLFEYCSKYRRQDISLIFLSNPDQGYTDEDHMLVLIGPVNSPEALLTGENSNEHCEVNPKIANQDLLEFLSRNKNSICADPLLGCAGNLEGGLTPLLDYCNKYNITHIIGVRSFHNTPGLLENLETIRNNAVAIAEKVKPMFNTVESAQAHAFSKSDIEQRLKTIKQTELHIDREIDLMLTFFNEMWDKSAAKGESELNKFRQALESLLSDMGNNRDLRMACSDLVTPGSINNEELFSNFLTLQQGIVNICYRPKHGKD